MPRNRVCFSIGYSDWERNIPSTLFWQEGQCLQLASWLVPRSIAVLHGYCPWHRQTYSAYVHPVVSRLLALSQLCEKSHASLPWRSWGGGAPIPFPSLPLTDNSLSQAAREASLRGSYSHCKQSGLSLLGRKPRVMNGAG